MSRIDDALRRSGNASARSRLEDVTPVEDVFTSPWAFREAVTPAAVMELRQEPASADDDRPLPSAGFSETELHCSPGFNESWMERLVIAPAADALLVEQFRQLAAALHHAQSANNVRVVMVTSAGASEGKSLTSVNLALTLSESYRQRVLLIDADLRRPSLHEVARVPGTRGLGEVLKSPSDQKLPVYELSETLLLVPAGKPDRDPMRALTSARMTRILEEASTHFDWVLIDAPPVGPIVDSTLLAANIDAAIMVVRAGQTSYAEAKKAVEALGKERILGVVLNGAEEVQRGGSHYYYQASPQGSAG